MSTAERRPMRPAWASKGTGSFGTPKRIGIESVDTSKSDCDLFNESVSAGNNQTYSRRTSRECAIRFTKDELLALRKPTKVLIEMSLKLPKNIIMDCSQLPESKTEIDESDIYRIWQENGSTSRGSKRINAGAGKILSFGTSSDLLSGAFNMGNR